ncbi:hypothetical protein ACWGLG_34215 [Streptomyces antimycoticus]
MKRLLRRCSHAPDALTPEGQAVADAFRAMLAALKHPEPWTPGRGPDVAVRVGPFVECAHTRPGDDHGPDIIAVALHHPRVHWWLAFVLDHLATALDRSGRSDDANRAWQEAPPLLTEFNDQEAVELRTRIEHILDAAAGACE